MRTAIDITLNIVVPLLLLIAVGRYVYRTGAFGKGFVMTWGLLAGYYWLSLFAGFIAFKFAPSYEGCFQEPRGAFVMTIFGGAMYGLVVSLTAMLVRYLVEWIKKITNGRNKAPDAR